MPLDLGPYDKGAKLWKQRRVVLENETESTRYYAVWGEHGEYKVRLQNGGITNCTCPFGSLKGAKGNLCSHMMAAILHTAIGEAPLPPAPASVGPAADDEA